MRDHFASFRSQARGTPGTPSEHPERGEGVPRQPTVNAAIYDFGTPGTPGTPGNNEGWRDFAPFVSDDGGNESARSSEGRHPETFTAQGLEGGRTVERPPAVIEDFRTTAPPVVNDWRSRMPIEGPGVTITVPAIEVEAAEYDANADRLIAEHPAGSPEANRLAFARRKGHVLPRGSERIFVRGRI